jgi:hypothetical protein
MGGGGGEVWTRSWRGRGCALGCASRNCGFWAKSPKPAHQGSVLGVPLETAVVSDGGRWWGGVDEVTAGAGLCVWLRKPGLRVLGQKPETGPPGLGLGRAIGDSGGGQWGGLWGGVDEVVAVVRMCIRARTRGRGLGLKKHEIQAILAWFQSASRLQQVEGGSVVSQGPLPWYLRQWLVGREIVW